MTQASQENEVDKPYARMPCVSLCSMDDQDRLLPRLPAHLRRNHRLVAVHERRAPRHPRRTRKAPGSAAEAPGMTLNRPPHQ